MGSPAVLCPFVPLLVHGVVRASSLNGNRPVMRLTCMRRERWFGKRSLGNRLFGGVAARSDGAEALHQQAWPAAWTRGNGAGLNALKQEAATGHTE